MLRIKTYSYLHNYFYLLFFYEFNIYLSHIICLSLSQIPHNL